jgi:arginase family enzyme
MQDISLFFDPVHFMDDKPQGFYQPSQIGASMLWPKGNNFSWEEADIVMLGCGERRGEDDKAPYNEGPNEIREQLYKMFNWHQAVKVADAGNIRCGATLGDTRAALLAVLNEIHLAGKIAVVIGGSHDLSLQQYEVFKKHKQLITIAVADMLIDLDESETITANSYLLDMLTSQPNYVGHYSHIGFQSYYAHPSMLETLDKLRFDFFRLGKARENIEDMEPVLRSSNMFSFDMNAVRYSDAPVNFKGSPNGFTGDEACQLTRYAGMSNNLSSFGIYGYDCNDDRYDMTAKLMAQMLWYFIDGVYVRKSEARLVEREEFITFNVAFTDHDTTFLKSKRTNRWWMKLPNQIFVPCSYSDYLLASKGDIPERWLREQERLL